MTHHAPSGPGDDDVRRALRADADRAATADPGAVWTRIEQGVQHRRRRRRELAGTGAAALAVIAIAVGANQLDGLVDGPDQARPAATAAPTAVPTPSPTSAPTAPATPTTDAATPAPSSARVPLAERSIPVTPEDARAAFREAGYDQDDAWQLGEVWRWGDVQDVEVVAGARLARGEQLPLQPGRPAAEATRDEAATNEAAAEEVATWQPYENLLTYTTAGYDDTDAGTLAERWGEEPHLVRMLVGELVRADELPAATD